MMGGKPNWWSMHPQPHSQFLLAASHSTPSPPQKKLEKWELDEALNLKARAGDEESSSTQTAIDEEFQSSTCWPCHHQPTSCIFSFSSCITALTNTIFNFSSSSSNHHHHQDHSSECHNGGESNKAWVQQSSPQPAFKVRKEKLGDRITALHQLVAPFGKADTASVLSETIGYIRFLEGQIEVEARKCMLSEELSQDSEGGSNLRSRGLCLVPVSCSQHVCNGIGANYWAQAAIGGGF